MRQDPAFARYDPSLVREDGVAACATGAGYRSRGRATRPRSASGPGPGQPWLPQPADWAALTVEKQLADPASMLALYRSALELRHDRPELGDGTMAWIDTDGDVLAFRRDPGFVCVVNVGGEPGGAAGRGARRGAVALERPAGARRPLPGTTSAWYAV